MAGPTTDRIMARAEVTTAPAFELIVVSEGVREKEPVSGEDYKVVMADRGQSALPETPKSQSGEEVHGADPACSEELSEHRPTTRQEEEPAGPPLADQRAAVTIRRHITGKQQGDGPSKGDGGGQRAAKGGDAAAAGAADEEEKAEEPESDAQQTDTKAQIKLEAQKQVGRHYQTSHELLCIIFPGGPCTITHVNRPVQSYRNLILRCQSVCAEVERGG